MTELLRIAMEAVDALPAEKQDELADLIMALAGDEHTGPVSPEFIRSITLSLEQADRREFATDDEVAAVWRKHGL